MRCRIAIDLSWRPPAVRRIEFCCLAARSVRGSSRSAGMCGVDCRGADCPVTSGFYRVGPIPVAPRKRETQNVAKLRSRLENWDVTVYGGGDWPALVPASVVSWLQFPEIYALKPVCP